MKTRFHILFVSGFLLLAGLTACNLMNRDLILTQVSGSGNVVTETRSVSGFDGITITGAGKILIDQNGSEALSVTADDNLMQHITTEVRDGKLVIGFTPRVVFGRVTALTFNVSAKQMNSIQLDGAAVVEGKNIAAENFSAKLNGAGAITLAGKVTAQEALLDGVGSYNAAELASQRAQVTQNGTGRAVVRVSDKLDAVISGVGSIEYIGNPQVTKTVSGLGVVRQAQ